MFRLPWKGSTFATVALIGKMERLRIWVIVIQIPDVHWGQPLDTMIRAPIEAKLWWQHHCTRENQSKNSFKSVGALSTQTAGLFDRHNRDCLRPRNPSLSSPRNGITVFIASRAVPSHIDGEFFLCFLCFLR